MIQSFRDYHYKREGMNEMFDSLKRKIAQAVGYQKEDPKSGEDKTSLDKVAAIKAGHGVAKAGHGGAEMLGAAGGIAASAATGNVVGVGKSIWDFIKAAANLYGGFKTMTSAGVLVPQVMKHKAGLHEYLSPLLGEDKANQVVEAIFEINISAVSKIPPDVWDEATKMFVAALESGYDNIEKKVFASVVYKALTDWLKQFGSEAGVLERAVTELMKETRVNSKILQQPEVNAAVEKFDPDGLQKKSSDYHQWPKAPDDDNDYRSDIDEPKKKIAVQWDDEISPSVTIDRWKRVPDKFFDDGDDTRIKNEMVHEFYLWMARKRYPADMPSKRLKVGEPIYINNNHYALGHYTKATLLRVERSGESGQFDMVVRILKSNRQYEYNEGDIVTFPFSGDPTYLSSEPIPEKYRKEKHGKDRNW